MSDADRNYSYLVKTFDAPQVGVHGFVEVMSRLALPTWRALAAAGQLEAIHVLRKVGDIDLQTSALPVRDWAYVAILELAEHASPDAVLAAEAAAGLDVASLSRNGIEYLSNEALVRPERAGTAIPLPSPHWPTPPVAQQAAVEYIQIPDRHWNEYRRFMKEVMGPVGARLVRLGASYQIQIMERVRVLHRDPSLPAWNRIHVLWGDFTDSANGFIARTNEAVRVVLGPEHDVRSALDAANGYRVKPRMSRNVLIGELSILRAPGDATSGLAADQR